MSDKLSYTNDTSRFASTNRRCRNAVQKIITFLESFLLILLMFFPKKMNETNEIRQAKAPGQKPKEVWNYFKSIGEKKDGHQGCRCNYCTWTQTCGELNIMEAHLALSCHKVPSEIKEKFLNVVKIRGENQTVKRKRTSQSQITKYYESDEII